MPHSRDVKESGGKRNPSVKVIEYLDRGVRRPRKAIEGTISGQKLDHWMWMQSESAEN
jgi:hypothetical protein